MAGKISKVIPASLMTMTLPVDWTMSDVAALKIFLNSRPGQKFAHLMRNNANLAAMTAIYGEPEKLQNAAGVAKGLEIAFNNICLLSACGPLQVLASSHGISLTEIREDDESEGPDDESPISYGSPISP